MIRHVVMWTFADVPEKNAHLVEAKRQIDALLGVVPSLRAAQTVVPAGDLEHTHDLLLIADFDTAAGLAEYAAHPAHVEVAKFIGAHRVTRACVDYEV